ncbi:helix-turn-helix transcriptional regulator [Lewinella sp. IMCC34183]|uniref:helix-turn-helix transcriptional regulator n=1 Tax=Lewinella sp. IMCC34183 TaxID=2248762 RepID=UPI000E23F146|nr:AraC family transcriptional regulator [Lewinella sp. IMCC34183]
MLEFTFTPAPGFNFLESFSQTFGLRPVGNRLQLPPEMGEGWLRSLTFTEDFRFTIHHYRLREPLRLRRQAPQEQHGIVSFIFYTTAGPEAVLRTASITYQHRYTMGMEVGSGDLVADILFPADTDIFIGVAAVGFRELRRLLHPGPGSELLRTLTDPTASFLYHESITPEATRLLTHLSETDDRDVLGNFYLRIRVEELLYEVLHQLALREPHPPRPVANTDLDNLFQLRARILRDLSQPPVLPELAREFQLSETRMKALFKQVFGETIYAHFQRARMAEAAALLRPGGHSVADVGYALGFTNLSHFSRLFKRYYGLTPKRYALDG